MIRRCLYLIFGYFFIFILLIIVLIQIAAIIYSIIKIIKDNKTVENKNKRVYTKETVDKAIEKFNETHNIYKYGFVGEIEHPTRSNSSEMVFCEMHIQPVGIKKSNIFKRLFRRK